MCGIAGFIGRDPKPDVMPRMLRRLAHRGPDGEGVWQHQSGNWNVTFGHRRLAIIDKITGAQPLGTDQAKITFNGEIYNYRELRAKLPGVSFSTASDTEVLLEHLKHERRLAELNGMFAFACWQNGKLTLARDPAGIKPLYYAPLSNGGLAFASELGALLEHPELRARIDPAALAEYFFLDYVHSPRSLVRGVFKLPPGTLLVWENGKLGEPRSYLPEIPLATEVPDPAARAEELLSKLEAAVERELVADVPVGVLLSGGLDSSLIAALMRRKRKEPFRTFSIGFADTDFDESRYARAVAQMLGTEHSEKVLREEHLVGGLRRALDCLDEPLADPSVLPTFLLAELAASQVKVVLSGDGGDELWAGYPTYRAAQWAGKYQRVPQIMRAPARQMAAALPPRYGYQSLEWKMKRFLLRWDDDPVRRHFRWMSSVDAPDLPLLSRNLDLNLDGLWPRIPTHSGEDVLQREVLLDYSTYLPGSVLMKVDRAAMAHGLEVRPPFLDPEFARWSMAQPASLKLHRARSKYLLKMAARHVLPSAITDRKKRGFAIPLARWLCGPLRDPVTSCLRDSPVWDFLDRETFAQWHREHLDRKVDRAKPLWALLVLDHWTRRFNAKI